jgi:hypothetical protein
MDRLIDAVAAYLCRHRSVGLLRLTLDLTRRGLELSAEVGAVVVVKGAAAPPAPGTEAWWRAAVREAVYALRHRRLSIRRRGGRWAGLLKKAVFISSSGSTHLTCLRPKPSLLHASVYFPTVSSP